MLWAAWDATLFLSEARLDARGWLLDVMKCVEAIGRPEFTLEDVYAFTPRLKALHPGNNNVEPKIRQQLQVLRDRGWLGFNGRGTYRYRPPPASRVAAQTEGPSGARERDPKGGA